MSSDVRSFFCVRPIEASVWRSNGRYVNGNDGVNAVQRRIFAYHRPHIDFACA